MQRLPLENAVFEGNNNAYLYPDDPVTLVDTGVATAATRRQFESALADHGLALADVDRVLLTHYHGDHSGLAAAVQDESGAPVHAHAADAALIAGDESAWDDLRERQAALFVEWGMPTDKREELLQYVYDGPELYGDAVDVTELTGGERFDVGETELTAIHAPGHAAGLTCFATSERELFSGDAILPHYTPNVGGADVRVERPLATYIDTLRRLRDEDFARAWPGHREPIDDPSGRATEIVEHHEERAARVLSVLADHGPADAWTVSAELFGELVEIHVLHGPGEAYAHLDHLVGEGAVERVEGAAESESATLYDVTEDAAARLDSLDDGRWPLS